MDVVELKCDTTLKFESVNLFMMYNYFMMPLFLVFYAKMKYQTCGMTEFL